MATVLLTDTKTVKDRTTLGGSIDSNKLQQLIKMAQDIHVESVLGTPLYEKLLTDVSASSVTGNYETLLDTYVVPMLCWWSALEYVEMGAFDVVNGGVQINRGDNSDSAGLGEIKFLAQKYRDRAEHYTQRLKDWLCENSTLVPEYNQATGSDVYPDSSSENFHGWEFGY